MSRVTVSINKDVHNLMVCHLDNGDRKISRFVEAAIREKVQKEKPKLKNTNPKNEKSQ